MDHGCEEREEACWVIELESEGDGVAVVVGADVVLECLVLFEAARGGVGNGGVGGGGGVAPEGDDAVCAAGDEDGAFVVSGGGGGRGECG